MPVAKLDLWNQAISDIGISDEIQSLTELSATRRACSRYYDQVHDEVLGSFPWPFATKRVALALVEEDPTPEWKYSYQYPTDCLTFRRILSTINSPATEVYTRNPILVQTIPFLISGTIILTDWQNAYGEYTEQVTDPSRFPPLFARAIALKMALYMAPRLTAGDPFKLGLRAAQMYASVLSEAQADALNEENPDAPPNSEFVQARDW